MLTKGAVAHAGYLVRDKIAQGEIGEVYKAERVSSGELCVLKVLSPELMCDSLLVERFKQEARRACAFRHPNAVRIEEAGEAENARPFVVMEYLRGENLRQVMAREGRLPVSRACFIAKQVATALEAAHARGIVHQDVTPDKIMLVKTPAGPQVSLLGCGMARIKEDHRRDIGGLALRCTGVLMGTPEYFSPEMAAGRRGDELDGRSDLYSLGIVLYQMLCGALPFPSPDPEAGGQVGTLFTTEQADQWQLVPAGPGPTTRTAESAPQPASACCAARAGLVAASGSGRSKFPAMDALLAHLLVPPRCVSRLCPEVPEELGRLVMKMLEKKPESRPASARVVVEELERVESLLRRTRRDEATPPPDSQRRVGEGVGEHTSRRRRRGLAADAAITALSLALVAWFLAPLRSKIDPYFEPPQSVPERAGAASRPDQIGQPPRMPPTQPSAPPAAGSPGGASAVSEAAPQPADAKRGVRPSQEQNTAGPQAAGSGKFVAEAQGAQRQPLADAASVRALTEEGDGFLQRGEYDRAIQSYTRALRLDPASEALHTRIARARAARAVKEKHLNN